MDARVSNLRSKLELYRAASNGGSLANCPIRDVVQGVFGRWSSLLAMCTHRDRSLWQLSVNAGRCRSLWPCKKFIVSSRNARLVQVLSKSKV